MAATPVHDVGDDRLPSQDRGDADSCRLHEPLVGDELTEGRPSRDVVLDGLTPLVVAGVPGVVPGGVKPRSNPTELPRVVRPAGLMDIVVPKGWWADMSSRYCTCHNYTNNNCKQ